MTGPIFITASKVAELTGFESGIAFLKERTRLETDLDFPKPMPTCRRPLKWRADAISAWTAVHGTFQLPETPPGGNVVLLQEARRP